MKKEELRFKFSWKIFAISLIVCVIALGMKMFFKGDLFGKSFMLLAFIISSYYSWLYIDNKKIAFLAKSILWGLGLAASILLVLNTWEAANSDSQWDFVGFYFEGLIGIYNLPFYNPESFKIIFNDLNTTTIFQQDLKEEVLNIGMLYPPTSMLILAPLAIFNPELSRIIFTILISLSILLNTYLLYSLTAEKQKSIYTFILIFVVVFFIPGTRSTLMYNQINFFLLLFLILMILKINKSYAGLFHALTILFKPITIFLIVHTIILKNWKNFIYFCLTGLFLVILTGLIWDFQNFADYFLSSPISKLPESIYIQRINQSLLATINRNLKIYDLSKEIIQFLYYSISFILLVVTVITSLRLNKISTKMSLFPFITFMLIIYPHSLAHYMVLILPVLIWFIIKVKSEECFWLMIVPVTACMQTHVFYSYIIIFLFLIYYGFIGHKYRVMKFR